MARAVGEHLKDDAMLVMDEWMVMGNFQAVGGWDGGGVVGSRWLERDSLMGIV